MATHERVWERGPDPRRAMAMGFQPVWHPKGTYGLLGTIVVVFILELIVQALPPRLVQLPGVSMELFTALFTITPVWYLHPWSLVTSTLSHGGFVHILFNGLVLFFFGPILERILGTRRFLWLFMFAGAVSGIVQVTLEPGPALGASGAIMMVFGALVVIMPHEKILVYGIIPVPFWVAGIGYALLDVFGALNPADGVGNFAHLAGMALGLWLGYDLRQRAKRRRQQTYVHWTVGR